MISAYCNTARLCFKKQKDIHLQGQIIIEKKLNQMMRDLKSFLKDVELVDPAEELLWKRKEPR